MKILIDAYQQHRINTSGGNANISENLSQIDDLKRKVDALSIACQALWEIVQTQTGMPDSAILQKMQEIDARDGKLDGKAARAATACPQCDRPNNITRTVCLYCGAPLAAQPA